MSKKEIDEHIIKIIENASSKGISLKELLNTLIPSIPARTLQYRLSKLVEAGLLRREGNTSQSKYFVLKDLENTEMSESEEVINTPFIIPFTENSQKLKKLLSVPYQKRRHVGYKREFLDSYKPNHTFYLSESILKKLSKVGSELEKGRPAGTYARKIYQRLLIDLSWNSSRLEGNTYSLLETEKLLEGDVIVGKDRVETQMILNHKDAIEFIVDMAEEVDINRYTILNIHGLLSNDLLPDPRACGRLRTSPVRINKSVYLPPEVPQLIEEYFHEIITKAKVIENPFEQSFFLMVHLPYLQLFMDVNKRVSRLVGNIPFIRENLSPLSFVDVPEEDYIQGLLGIYEFNKIDLFRDVFVWAYERSASLYGVTLEAIGEPDPFRIRYRDLIRLSVSNVVRNEMGKLEASEYLSLFAIENVPLGDRARFTEITETELRSLHEGNFARFKIRPSEFFGWQKNWK